MRFAYLLARGKVCAYGNDLRVCGMQTARMAENHLKAWRKHRRMTQEELADAVGTTKAVISNIETGSRGLSDKWLRKLAPALGTTPGFLLDYSPDDLDGSYLEAVLAVPPGRRKAAIQILDALKTGTDG